MDQEHVYATKLEAAIKESSDLRVEVANLTEYRARVQDGLDKALLETSEVTERSRQEHESLKAQMEIMRNENLAKDEEIKRLASELNKQNADESSQVAKLKDALKDAEARIKASEQSMSSALDRAKAEHAASLAHALQTSAVVSIA